MEVTFLVRHDTRGKKLSAAAGDHYLRRGVLAVVSLWRIRLTISPPTAAAARVSGSSGFLLNDYAALQGGNGDGGLQRAGDAAVLVE